MSRVYKIITREEWAQAQARGVYGGSVVDRADGFIHLSAEDQAAETLRLHFAGQTDMVVVGFEAAALGPALKWEASRGGALFPHLYGPLPAVLAVSVQDAAALGAAGGPD